MLIDCIGYFFVFLLVLTERILEYMGFVPDEITFFPIMLIWVWLIATVFLVSNLFYRIIRKLLCLNLR